MLSPATTLRSVTKLLASHQTTSTALVKFCYARATLSETTLKLNNFTHLYPLADLLLKSSESDTRWANNTQLSPMDGVPVAIKANICIKDEPTTACSNVLDKPNAYRPPFHADSVQKLVDAGAIIIGTTNMDEFGMGSLNRNSNIGPAINSRPFRALDTDESALTHGASAVERLSPGGSSGGSASAVAFRSSFAALGTDTGGSVRLPAAWCGVAGFKPGYGRISRHGVIPYASSLDTVGILASTADDCRIVYDVVKGGSYNDSTSVFEDPIEEQAVCSSGSLENVRVGVPTAYSLSSSPAPIQAAWAEAASSMEERGATIVVIDDERLRPETVQLSLAAYYVVACAEAASNLSKYDGIRFGNRATHTPALDYHDEVAATRKEFFGSEVLDRIACGNDVLSKEGTHYLKAMAVRHNIKEEFIRCFSDPDSSVDCLLIPAQASLPVAQEGGELGGAAGFGNDLFTCGVSLSGLPAITVPRTEGGISVQLVGREGGESQLLAIAEHLSINCNSD